MAAFWAIEPGFWFVFNRCPASPAENLLLVPAFVPDHMEGMEEGGTKSFGSSWGKSPNCGAYAGVAQEG